MNKKGFTIVEIITVIFILALVVLVFVSNFEKTTDATKNQQINKADTELNDAINIYYHLAMNDKKLDYFINEDGEITTCIYLDTLVSNGYLNETMAEKLSVDGDFAFITVSSATSKLNYELKTYNQDKGLCEYNQIHTSGVYEVQNNLQGETEEEGLGLKSFDQSVEATGANTFSVNMDLSFKALTTIEHTKSTYVILALDISGSMASGSRLDSALNAIRSSVNTFVNGDANICLAFMTFGQTTVLRQPFTTNSFTVSATINPSGSGENYTHTFKLAKDIFFAADSMLPFSYTNTGSYAGWSTFTSTVSSPLSSDSKCANRLKADNKILMFISDGNPDMSWDIPLYLTAANELKAAGSVDDRVKIITNGYNLSSSILENIASRDCDDRPNKICYYNSDTTSLSSQLQSFAQETIRLAKESKYNKIRIEFEINNDYFKFKSQSGNKMTFEYDMTNLDAEGNFVLPNLAVDIVFSPEKKIEDSISPDMFKNIKVTFYNDTTNEKYSENLQSPIIMINSISTTAIN